MRVALINENSQASKNSLIYETLSKVADGQSTKIILPADLSGIASLGTVLTETMKDKK